MDKERLWTKARPALLVLSAMPLALLWRRHRDREAEEALKRWRERQRRKVLAGKKEKMANKGKEAKKNKRSSRRRKLLRLLLLTVAQEAISRRRDDLRRQLSDSRLVRHLPLSQQKGTS